MMSDLIHLNDSAFEETVLKSSQPVLVDFWAPWCAPCRIVAPLVDAISKEYAGKLVVAKVDIDENQQWASNYGVRSIPTLLFFSEGRVVHQQVGAVRASELKRIVDEVLASAPKAQKSLS
jgi:thioredoxin 1